MDHSGGHVHSGESPRSKVPDEVLGTHKVPTQQISFVLGNGVCDGTGPGTGSASAG